MKHVVKFRESDSWSGVVEIWHRGYDTEEEARLAAHNVNKHNTAKTAPDVYTTASYLGPMAELPKDES